MNQSAVSIFSALGVVLTLGGLMLTEHNSLHSEINGLRSDFREDLAALRSDMREDDAALRSTMEESHAALRFEIEEGDAALRSEMEESHAGLHSAITGAHDDIREIRGSVADMSERLARVETRLDLPDPDVD